MAKLVLKFEKTTLKEFPLTRGVHTIGRLPDNGIQIDNPAVSGHHANVYWDAEQFILEDKGSFNGTYINDQRISKQALRDNDTILVGKHTLVFKAEAGQEIGAAMSGSARPVAAPSLDATAMLDTKKARELLAQAAKSGAASAASAPARVAPVASRMRRGMLTVISGKTDQPSYVLTSKLSVIGKSEMATIRLKGWFAPKVAGTISQREDRYFIAPADGKQRIKVNGRVVAAQQELNAGDMIAVGKVTMTFDYSN